MALLALSVSAAAIQIKKKDHTMETPARSADSVLSEADTLFRQNDLTAAFTAYEEAYTLARAEFNRSVEVEALSQLARVELRRGNKDAGRQWLAKAGERADEVDPMGWSRYLGVKGRFEWQDNTLTAARATFEQMYEYCVANALWSRAVDAAHMVAIVAEPFEDQVRWGRRGIEMAEKAEAESWLGPLWNNLAGSYFDHGDYDSALACYQRAREYHWRFSGETGKLFADYHVGMTLR
ncbi:MAG: tetratricopeptide repeat protein, partial [Candidatus Zixiibacteriota bacterium]